MTIESQIFYKMKVNVKSCFMYYKQGESRYARITDKKSNIIT